MTILIATNKDQPARRQSGIISTGMRPGLGLELGIDAITDQGHAMKLCAQCRSNYADNDEPDVGPADAEFYVQGTVLRDDDSGRRRPYRANLCDDHVEIMLEDDDFKGTIRALPGSQRYQQNQRNGLPQTTNQ